MRERESLESALINYTYSAYEAAMNLIKSLVRLWANPNVCMGDSVIGHPTPSEVRGKSLTNDYGVRAVCKTKGQHTRGDFCRTTLMRDKSCLVYVEKLHGRESHATSRAE